MSNLATKNTNDFTVTDSGEAFISQSAVSRLTGIPQQTLSDWIRKKSVDVNTNELNQLDAISLQKVAIVGCSKYITCQEFMGKLLEAGAKAYIYHEAGYEMQAIKVPQDFAEALQLAADQQKQIQAMLPKAHFHDQMFTQNKRLSMNEFAKVLTDSSGVKIGQNKMMKFLRESKYLMIGRDATERNKPYQKYMDAKWFEVDVIETPVGMRTQPLITPLGQTRLADIITNFFGG